MCDTGCSDSTTATADRTAASRRAFLGAALAAGGAAMATTAFAATAPPASATPPRPNGDQIVMLGTGGGPVIRADSARPASALVVNGAVYLVDCGAETPHQLAAAGLSYSTLSNVFLTHQHLDHTSGLPTLAAHGWVAQPRIPAAVDVWGPPSMSPLTEGIPATYQEGIGLFSVGNPFGPFPDLRPHDVVASPNSAPVRVLEDGNVTVDAVWVQHNIPYAYAYRFTIKRTGKIVVFSGDVVANEPNLIALARNCDVLVHEVLDPEKVEEVLAGVPEQFRDVLRQRIVGGHSSVYDVPGVAKAAEAKKLVLNHYTPVPQRPADWLRKARQAARQAGYRGDIVAPVDLDVVRL